MDWQRLMLFSLGRGGDALALRIAVHHHAPDFMNPGDLSLPHDRIRLTAAVRSRSWDWLLALGRRLNVDLQIVDTGHEPLLGRPSDALAADVPVIPGSDDPQLKLLLSTCIRTRTSQALRIDQAQLGCFPLTIDRMVGGALVLAMRSPDAHAEKARNEVELVGSWLRNAIEAHLTSPSASEEELARLSSFWRILHDSVSRGADSGIVAAFVEMLAVWHDLEAYGYIETPGGSFVRAVTLAGVDLSKSPTAIGRELLPEDGQLSRLPVADVERLGFATSRDLAVKRLGEGAGSWLIAISGVPPSHELPALTLYLSLLDDAMESAISVWTARVVASMSTLLFADEGGPEEQANRALAELRDGTGAASIALAVTTAAGAPVVRVISPAPAAGKAALASDGIVVERRTTPHYTVTLGLRCTDGGYVTKLQIRAASAAADVIESWVRWILRLMGGERRRTPLGFRETVERAARQALEQGDSVALLVLSFGADILFRPGAAQERIVRIRGQMRAADLVGLLGAQEIGILLRETPDRQVRAVAGRLRSLIDAGEDASSTGIRVGLASRSPAAPAIETLVQDARDQVIRLDDAI
jgi:hypothetical protein